jgi:16S rRNA (cytidine1402-2'-O)-methyltransferase
MDNTNKPNTDGTLYVVATPIGHMEDITLRALSVLRQVHLVAAEDTRQAGLLFAHHHIEAQLISYHEHNETERTPALIQRLQSGEEVALICSAGTPAISDPGYRLVKTAISQNIPVIPVPGVSAVISALSVSGLPTDEFVFIGFLPRKQGKRLSQLKALADEARTIIFYESPKRIQGLLKDIHQFMGDRDGMLSREMTKPYEEFIRGTVSYILHQLEKRSVVKGECTLLISGKTGNMPVSTEEIQEEIRSALLASVNSLGDISKAIAKKYNVSRQLVYSEALKIKKN